MDGYYKEYILSDAEITDSFRKYKNGKYTLSKYLATIDFLNDIKKPHEITYLVFSISYLLMFNSKMEKKWIVKSSNIAKAVKMSDTKLIVFLKKATKKFHDQRIIISFPVQDDKMGSIEHMLHDLIDML